MGNSTTLWCLWALDTAWAQKNPVSYKRHTGGFLGDRVLSSRRCHYKKISRKINMLVGYFVLGMIIRSIWHTSCNDAGHSRSDLNKS